MSDAGLYKCLCDGLTPREWYRMLNSKVFFWVTRERLEKMLNARAYKKSGIRFWSSIRKAYSRIILSV